MNRFARWLSDWLFWKNMTQRQLAAEIGISQSAISAHISGKRNPTYRTVRKYCQFFGEPDHFSVYELTLMK